MLLSTFAVTYDWEYWDDRCADYSGDDGTDFTIYMGNSSYRLSSGILVIEVEPNVDVVKYVPEYSQAKFADFERSLIPNGFEFPSTISLRVSNNYSFFVPFGYLTKNDFFMRVVTNNSEGAPRCSQLEWEINDTRIISDSELSIDVVVEFNPEEGRFVYDITNNEAEEIPVSIAVFSGTGLHEVRFVQALGKMSQVESKNTYESIDVAQGIYEVYAVAATDEGSFFETFDLFQFYDFDMTVPTIPKFHPGDSYNIFLKLTNLGYMSDSYNISFDTPQLWVATASSSGEIEGGQDVEIQFSYTVSEYQVGSETITINVTSKNSGVTKVYEFKVEPEKLMTLLITLRDIPEITAYSNNNMTMTAASAGTISPRLYYYVYTEPALLLRRGIGTMVSQIGEINKRTINFNVGGSCAVSDPDTLAFNAGRKVLMLGNVVYYLTSEIDESGMSTLAEIEDIVEAEKLKMTSEDAGKLFTNTDRLLLSIHRFQDGWEYEEDAEYYRALRENLYLFLVDLEGTLQDVGERMSETCSSVDQVDLHLFVIDIETLQYQDIPRSLPVTGPKVIEFIGPSELRAVSGTSTYFDYTLKNNAGEGFEVDITPSSDVVKVSPAYTYLASGTSKDVEVRVSAPDYFEAENLQVYIEIKTRTYTLNFPVVLNVGIFEPELIAENEYAVSPGATQYFNITLRTGGVDDTFAISSSGPTWITLPERIVTRSGEAIITVKASPSSQASGEEYLELTFRPESFPDYSVSDSITIFVSTEANELMDRLRQNEGLLIDKEEVLSQQKYIEATRYLDKAETAITQNEYTTARLNLKRAEDIIFSVTEEEGINWGLIMAGAVLVVFAGVFWKFLLPKIRGTTEIVQVEEEVI